MRPTEILAKQQFFFYLTFKILFCQRFFHSVSRFDSTKNVNAFAKKRSITVHLDGSGS